MAEEKGLMEAERRLTYVDPAAVSAAETAKARIQAAFIMALKKPRDADQARDSILRACKRPIFAARVEYSKPIGQTTIKGPSIRFAELALREWGNVLTETQVVYEDENIRRIKIFVTDLETNATHSKEIQITKTVERRKAGEDREVVGERMNTYGQKVYIVKATDDEMHNKEAALISKALRNEGLRLLPSDIIDEAVDIARETMRKKDSEDPEAAKKIILDSFSEIGIKPKDLSQYLKHSLDSISPAELQDLRGMYRAIKDGEATWADYLKKGEQDDGGGLSEEEKKAKIAKFNASWPKDAPELLVDEFLKRTGQANRVSKDEAMILASDDLPRFWDLFEKFRVKKAASDEAKREEGKGSSPPGLGTEDPGLPNPPEQARQTAPPPPTGEATEVSNFKNGKFPVPERVDFLSKTYPDLFKRACNEAQVWPPFFSESGMLTVLNKADEIFKRKNKK